MDPNSVIHLWMSAIRLSDFGRHDEALRADGARGRAHAARAARRGHVCASARARGTSRRSAGEFSEELRDRAHARVHRAGGAADDGWRSTSTTRKRPRRCLQENIDAMTGPTAIVTHGRARARAAARSSATRPARARTHVLGDFTRRTIAARSYWKPIGIAQFGFRQYPRSISASPCEHSRGSE